MQITPKLLTVACAGILLFASCDKATTNPSTTPTPNTPTKTKKDYLLEGKWQVTSMVAVSNYKDTTKGIDTTFTQDNVEDFEACEKDNTLTFLTSGKILGDEGATKCDPADPQTDSTGTWSLNSDFSKLTIVETGDPAQTFGLDEANATTLKMTLIDEGVDGTATYKTTLTFTAKNVK